MQPWIEPAIEDSDAGVIEIDWLFRQKIAGLRRLPKHERPHALRAARDVRQAALKALRARRAIQRAANYLLRQQQKGPAPR